MTIESTGGDGRTYILRDQDGQAVPRGAVVPGFRGMYRIDGGRAPQHGGSSGRIWTDRGEFFPDVADLHWEPQQ